MSDPAKVNGVHVDPPLPPGTVTITERCFKCEKPVGPLEQFTFSGVLLCEPCYRETVKASEAPSKPRRRRKKHVPIAPAGSVPSGEVEWKATLLRDVPGREAGLLTFPREQTWFYARAAAMAIFGCGPRDLEVVRA